MNKYFEFAIKVMLTKKSAVGNCGELSLQAYHYLKYKYPHLSSERYHMRDVSYNQTILEGDHAFVVIGDPIAAGVQISNWSKEVVFSDPWRHQSYSVSDASCVYAFKPPILPREYFHEMLDRRKYYQTIYSDSLNIISQCNRALKENINYLITHLNKMDEPNIKSLLEKNAYLSQFPSFVKETQRFINDSPVFNIVAYLQRSNRFF